MLRKVRLSICLVMMLSLMAGVVRAQEGNPRPTPTNIPPESNDTPSVETEADDDVTRGSIRGTVYDDKNADGSCANDPILAGVPIKFVSNDQQWTGYLQSGENGTYGLVAAGLGTWTVTAEPGAGMIVTSKNPLQVFIGEANRLALGVDFCVAKGTKTTGTGTVILPTAGAAVAPSFIISGLSGLGLIVLGFGMEVRRRRQK